VICPRTIYLCYGDTRLLEARYESMRRFIRFLAETNRDGLRCYAATSSWPVVAPQRPGAIRSRFC